MDDRSHGVRRLSGALTWAVHGWNGENVIRADGATEPAAWRAAIDQARGLGMLSGQAGANGPTTTSSTSRIW